MEKFYIKHLSSLLVLLISLCTLSCTADNDDMDWTEEKVIEILPEIVPTHIFGEPNEVDGMRVKIKGEDQWHVYPTHFIEGFEFEPGYSYILRIRVTHLANPPQDWYDVEYKLVELMSKKPAESSKKKQQ